MSDVVGLTLPVISVLKSIKNVFILIHGLELFDFIVLILTVKTSR